MTTTDALTVLRALTLTDLFSGAIVRDADETGDDSELAEIEGAAASLGMEIVEDEDGGWAIA